MKVKDFKERMSVISMLLRDWRTVSINDLHNGRWVNFLRAAAEILWGLADDLERDVKLGDK